MTIVHAFDSPDWFAALRSHLRGASSASGLSENELQVLFNSIGDLQVGESLVFASQALLDVDNAGVITRLGGSHKKMMTRPRLSNDGMFDSHLPPRRATACYYSSLLLNQASMLILDFIGGNSVVSTALETSTEIDVPVSVASSSPSSPVSLQSSDSPLHSSRYQQAPKKQQASGDEAGQGLTKDGKSTFTTGTEDAAIGLVDPGSPGSEKSMSLRPKTNKTHQA